MAYCGPIVRKTSRDWFSVRFNKLKSHALAGAMGTMIQELGLSEADFRGTRFADHPMELQGANDLLAEEGLTTGSRRLLGDGLRRTNRPAPS